MKWSPWILSSLTAFALGACGGERQNSGTGDTGTESGTMQGGAATDTGVTGSTGTGTIGDTTQGATSDTLHSGGDTTGAAH